MVVAVQERLLEAVRERPQRGVMATARDASPLGFMQSLL
jgi:hypothetical protein